MKFVEKSFHLARINLILKRTFQAVKNMSLSYLSYILVTFQGPFRTVAVPFKSRSNFSDECSAICTSKSWYTWTDVSITSQNKKDINTDLAFVLMRIQLCNNGEYLCFLVGLANLKRNPDISSISFKSIVTFKQAQRDVELYMTGSRSRSESAGTNSTVRSYLYSVNRTWLMIPYTGRKWIRWGLIIGDR